MTITDFTLFNDATATMRAEVLASPLAPVLVAASAHAERLNAPLRLHLTLDGELRVAALLADPAFHKQLAAVFLTTADVERATLRFSHEDLSNLSYRTEALGVDLGTAALLEEAVKGYVSGVRRAAERAAGLSEAPPTEGEIAASSSLNAGWFGQDLSARVALRRSRILLSGSDGELPF